MALFNLPIFLDGPLRADEVTPTRLCVKEGSKGVDDRRWVCLDGLAHRSIWTA